MIGRDRGGLSDTVEVTVTVLNGPDDGEITLDNPSPRVAEWITAELVDEDGGVENTLWTWPRTTPGGASDDGAQGQADASHRHYVPLRALGQQLQARVNYDDDYAEENTAISDKTDPVRANVPGAPLSLQATPGHRQVRLRWTPAATRGAAIDSYQVRQDEGRWSTVPGLGAARDTTITGLTNSTSYTFEVRAHNSEGAGAAASVDVVPAGGPGPATLSADPGDRQVALTWTAAAPHGAEVDLYEIRYRSGLDLDRPRLAHGPRWGRRPRHHGDGSEQRHGLHLPAPGPQQRGLRRHHASDGHAGHGARHAGPEHGPGRRAGGVDVDGRGQQWGRCGPLRDPLPQRLDLDRARLAPGPRRRSRPRHHGDGSDQRHHLHLPGPGPTTARATARPTPRRPRRPGSPARRT